MVIRMLCCSRGREPRPEQVARLPLSPAMAAVEDTRPSLEIPVKIGSTRKWISGVTEQTTSSVSRAAAAAESCACSDHHHAAGHSAVRAAVGGVPRPGARAEQGGGGAAVRAARGGVMMMCDSDVMRLELET